MYQKLKLVLIAQLLLLTVTINAQEAISSNWILVYENDADGNRVAGDLDQLIALIRGGEEIRIAWWSQRSNDPTIKVEHLADAKFLTIISDQVVFAQIDPIIGQSPDFTDQQILLQKDLVWTMIAASNGKSDAITRNMINGDILGRSQGNRAYKWYAKKR